MNRSHAALSFLAVVATAPLLAENPTWATWRGEAASGSAVVGSYPAKLDAEHLLWEVELPGPGCSTPIVWDGQIILTSPIGENDGVLTYTWDGRKTWEATVGTMRKGKHRNGSSCNPSAVTDGEFIFAYFKSGNLGALTWTGKPVWKTNLQERYGKDSLYWDLGTSPVLTRKHVVVAVMHSSGSFLAAFDKKTGDVAWKVDRNYKTPVEGDHSYATPHVLELDGKEVIVVWGSERVTIHDAANGDLISECGGFNPKEKKNWVVVASSVVAGNTLVVPYGRGSHLAGIKLGGKGDVTETHRLWTRGDKSGAFVPTPAVHDGKLYILGDRGEVHCLDPKSGETVWTNKLPRGAQSYYASPTIADGKIYAAREDGMFFVAKLDKDLEVLFERDFGTRIVASPVAVGDRILLRSDTHLMCFGAKK